MRRILTLALLIIQAGCSDDSPSESMRVKSVAPEMGSAGTVVTITGANFGAETGTVHLGETPIAVKSWGTSKVEFILPSEAPPGSWPLRLAADGNKAKAEKPFRVLPNILHIEPLKGIGGAPVTLSGTNFGIAPGIVLLKDVNFRLEVVAWGPSLITAKLATDTVGGFHDLIVLANDMESNPSNFTVTPLAAGVAPATASGGDTIQISGQGFGGTKDGVLIGSTPAGVKSWTSTTIKAVVSAETSPGIQTVKVVVGGEENSELLPMVLVVNPRIDSGEIVPVDTGAHLVLTGVNFGTTQGASSVTLDLAPMGVSSWSNTRIELVIPVDTASGEHFIYVTSNGVVSNLLTREFLPVIGSFNPARISGGAILNVTGAFFGDFEGTLQIGSTTLGIGQWTNSLIQSDALSNTLNPGQYTVSVSVDSYDMEKAGLIVAPKIDSMSHSLRHGGESLTLNGKNFGSSTAVVSVDNVAASTTSWNSTGIVITVPNSARAGARTVTVTAGGIISDPRSLEVSPFISTQSALKASRFESLTLGGTGLTSGAASDSVSVGGVAASVSSWGVLSTTFMVPDVEANTYSVSLQAGGVSSNSISLNIAPIITSLAPAAGAAGETIVVHGAGFGTLQLAATVTIAGLNATVTGWSPTAITIVTPAVTSGGTVPVVVTRNGISSGGFGYTYRPIIENLSPLNTSVGHSLTLTGAHFGTSGNVTVGGIAATSVSWTDGTVVVKVPQVGLGEHSVVMSRNGISSTAATISILPGIDGFDRQRAPIGAIVTLTGTNLGATQGASQFYIGSATITPSIWSANTLQFTVPSFPMGTYAAQVTVSSFASYPIPFTVSADFSGMTPLSGSTPSVVTLSGNAFGAIQGTSSLSIGGIVPGVQSWSNEQITFLLPSELVTAPLAVVVQVNGVETASKTFFVIAKISSLSASAGRSGDAISVFGNHLGSSGILRLSNSVVSTTGWNNQQIDFNVPSSLPGSVYTLTSETGGYASNPTGFIVTPHIDSFSPSRGIISTTITLTGVHFGSIQGTVDYDDMPASIVGWSNTAVQIKPPVNAELGSANVVITANQLQTNTVVYMLAPDLTVPELTSVTATTSPNRITLTGARFGATQGESQVKFGAFPVAALAWSDTQITIDYADDFEPGQHAVTVTVYGGVSASKPFAVLPVLESLTPQAGAPGETLRIAAKHIGVSAASKKVLFGDGSLSPLLWTPSYVDFVIPSYAAPGTFPVALLAGGMRTEKKWLLVVRPWIDDRYPSLGSAGTVVTILGRNFGDVQGTVTMGPMAATIQGWATDTVQVSVPAGLPQGEHLITLTAGMASNAQVFTILGADQWVTSDEPSGREGHSAVWTGTEMVVWGGQSSYSEARFNTGAKYNPITDSWVAMRREGAPVARSRHAAIWTGKAMIITGGYGGSNFEGIAGGSHYDPATDTWSPAASLNQPSARGEHTSLWTGTEMIVWGGYSLSSGYLNTGARYQPSGDLWLPMSMTNAPTARKQHAAAFNGSEMLVWGGKNADALLSGGRYDPESNVWASMNTTNGPAGESHRGAWTGTHFLVFGSSGASGRYEPIANTWQINSTVGGPGGRWGFSAVWTGSELIIWGGGTTGGGRYDPLSNTWAPITADTVTPRYSHSAVWTGTEMLLFGGYSYRAGRQGARYRPLDNTLIPMSVDVPHIMWGSTNQLVWTGSEIIVWSGYLGGVLTKTGLRYNPTTHTWLPTTTVGAPYARSDFSAVWTGDKMFIWGGYDTSYSGDGAMYDPATDTWSGMNSGFAPSPRAQAPPVWDGTRVMVWGGTAGANVLSAGASYRPALNSWTALATSGAPLVRYKHAAVWLGGYMVIWGGHDRGEGRNVILGNGGRYNPVNNSWTTLTSTGAPSARIEHAFVSSSTEMIIWGGFSSSGAYLNDGARYNPSTNVWTNMAASPLAGRSKPGFLWTGSEMLIWGGFLATQTPYEIYSDGAKYNPGTNTWSSIASSPDASAGAMGFSTPNGVSFFVHNTLMRYFQ